MILYLAFVNILNLTMNLKSLFQKVCNDFELDNDCELDSDFELDIELGFEEVQ